MQLAVRLDVQLDVELAVQKAFTARGDPLQLAFMRIQNVYNIFKLYTKHIQCITKIYNIYQTIYQKGQHNIADLININLSFTPDPQILSH